MMKTPPLLRIVSFFVLSLALLLTSSLKGVADEARYVYDDLGRLYQVIDPQGEVATYNYDAVGNLLSITRGIGAPPEVTGISPDSVGVGITVDFTISGNRLSGTTIRTDNPGISVSKVRSSETSIEVAFDLSSSARLGQTLVTARNLFGSSGVGFTKFAI